METRIRIHNGDITKLYVDAIVNAAKTTLTGGGGVDGAIHAAAGEELLKECKTLNGCETGDAKITKGYKLPAKYVIHTVGPVWGPDPEEKDKLLASCYRRSLEVALENGIRTIAFPNISTGIYRFPAERAAKIAVAEVKKFVNENKGIDEVIFVTFNFTNYELYKNLLQ
jgi:O-acetyl-ADP-ribose deacetylase (regulator of RNase III)